MSTIDDVLDDLEKDKSQKDNARLSFSQTLKELPTAMAEFNLKYSERVKFTLHLHGDKIWLYPLPGSDKEPQRLGTVKLYDNDVGLDTGRVRTLMETQTLYEFLVDEVANKFSLIKYYIGLPNG